MNREYLAALVGLLFQVFSPHFWPFFRYGYGRRHYRLVANVLFPLVLIGLGVVARAAVPQYIVYAPLRILPPFNWDPEYRLLIHSSETRLPLADGLFFAGFAVLFLVFSSFHYVKLVKSRWRNTDPTYTYFWGHSWLARFPSFGRLELKTLQARIEPAIVFVLGYLLCAVAPAFGMYLMAGGIVFALDEAVVWGISAERQLDARDALHRAAIVQHRHRAARDHQDRVAQTRAGALSTTVLARIQKNPHALLALTPDETRAAHQQLGSERFSELCNQLPPEAQEEIYGRFIGLAAARAQSATAGS